MALMVVMFVMLGLLALGMTSLWLTSGNLQVAGNMSMRTQAFYCAEAGIERARAYLNTAPFGGASAFLNTLLVGATPGADNVPTAIDGTTGRPNGVGAVLIDATGAMRNVAFPPDSFARGTGPSGAPESPRVGAYTVWIRNDTTECRRGACTVDSNGAVVLRSQCVAVDGRTTVVLEASFAPPSGNRVPVLVECLDSGKNVDEANTNTVHCSRQN